MREHKCFVFRFADVEVREREFCVTKAGEPLPLEPKVFRVLQFLLHHRGELVTKAELLDAVWKDVAVTENSPARAVAQLRRVLGDDIREPRFIATVATVGYRFVCPVEKLDDGLGGLNGSSPVKDQNDEESAVPKLGAIEPGRPTGMGDSQTEAKRRGRRLWLIPVGLATGVVLVCVLIASVGPKSQSGADSKLTHIASNFECGCGVLWSSDGKAIAYARDINGTEQLFLRYLNSPIEIQLTHEPHRVHPLGWLPDQTHILFYETAEARESEQYKLLSVATVGGEPEFVMRWSGGQAALSEDGKTFASFSKGDHGEYGVQVSNPIGSPAKWYSPDSFKTKTYLNRPGLKFMPGGKAILLTYDDEKNRFHSWLLPYPPGTKAPEPDISTLPKVPAYRWSWMPDRRHLVTPWAEQEGSPTHLWMWDTGSQERIPLTSGAQEDSLPRVAPDGSKLVFAQFNRQTDLVELSLLDGSATTLITSGRQESMASWSSTYNRMAWVSDRNGPSEIWVGQADGTQQPVVTPADFPSGTNRFFMNPAISPDSDRIIYEKPGISGAPRLWISSLRGGVPVPLTNAQDGGSEWGGSWSPDGERFVYSETKDDNSELMIVKTTGNATPAPLQDMGGEHQIPAWSPKDNWIAFQDGEGWHLTSPDGRTKKFLGKIETAYLEFSKDGKLLYGIQEGTDTDPHSLILFSLDIETLKVKNIKKLDVQLAPVSQLNPGIRFSLTPDGKHLVYSIFKGHSDLWLLEGLQRPDWLGRLRDSIMRRDGH